VVLAHSSRDAINDANRAHRRYVESAIRAIDDYRSALSTQLKAAQAEHARRRHQLDRAERDFQEALEDERRHKAHERDTCSRRFFVSGKAVQELNEALTRFSVLSSHFTETISRLRLSANQRLTFLDEALFLYGIEPANHAGGTDAGLARTLDGKVRSDSQASPLDSFLNARGMRLIPVERADFTDNPILSWRTDVADYLWACEKWDRVVSKAISQGQDREDLAKRDEAAGSTNVPMRQVAYVWDLFLGGRCHSCGR
jgi:hypothetical protein